MMRVVFMGTPSFAVPTFMEIAGQGHEIPAVYTQPPRPAGRGMGGKGMGGKGMGDHRGGPHGMGPGGPGGR